MSVTSKNRHRRERKRAKQRAVDKLARSLESRIVAGAPPSRWEILSKASDAAVARMRRVDILSGNAVKYKDKLYV